MEEKRSFTSKISFKLLVLIILLVAAIGSIIGITSYQFAKKELVESGKLDLAHLTETATQVLILLNGEVDKGNLTLAEAQEQAREVLIGPAGLNDKILYDYSESAFVYKKDGYLFAYNSEHDITLHPVIPIGKTEQIFRIIEVNMLSEI